MPLWLGIAPFGAVYGVSARAAGLSPFDTQLMSVIVFAGGAQFSAAGLFAAQASMLSLVLTTFLINLRHLLYGLSLGKQIEFKGLLRLLAAHFLTDEAYGMTITSPQKSSPFFLGAGFSVFFIWNLCTLLGSLMSRLIPDPAALSIDFIFPLAFLALLIPLLKRFQDLLVVLVAGFAALLLSPLVPPGLEIFLAAVGASCLGASLPDRDSRG